MATTSGDTHNKTIGDIVEFRTLNRQVDGHNRGLSRVARFPNFWLHRRVTGR
jgi:hypothetical protein